MIDTRHAPRVLAALALSLAPRPVRAEEKADLGANQRLRADTVVQVDIVDPATEQIRIRAEIEDPGGSVVPVDVTVETPTGGPVGTFPSGSLVTVGPEIGAYSLVIESPDLDGDQLAEPLTEWEFTVVAGGVDRPGRIWSRRWRIDAELYTGAYATDGSFYTVVPGGSPADEGVVELKAAGLAGAQYSLIASQEGIVDGNGRSRPLPSDLDPPGTPVWSATGENPIYLREPDPAVVNYNVVSPVISDAALDAEGTCGFVAPGVPGAEALISVTSSVTGVAHVVCDLDANGVFDLTSDDDFHLLVEVRAGTNAFRWNGQDNTGSVVPLGDYECRILLTVGEFHFVASDIETSYPGFRMFAVDAGGDRTGLPMYWNDAEVQSRDVQMPNGAVGLERSGPDGLHSGDYLLDPATPNVNARSWGAFAATSKGDGSLLDTYTWLDEAEAGPFEVRIRDAALDTDADGLVDAEEECVVGTDPGLADTDADGLDDLLEVRTAITDPRLGDSDGDGLGDGVESGGAAPFPDADGDGLEDPIDPDDDDDGIATADEPAGDPDGDGLDAHLDDDDDGDGVPTADEDLDEDGDWTDEDSDGDGVFDWLDPDDDDDGVLDEDIDRSGDPSNDDSDLDGLPDYRDDDDDQDGVPTADEADLDGDGVLDDADDDGLPNYRDEDDDDDDLPTLREGADDTDGDGDPDFLDEDADDDGIPDGDDGLGDIDGDRHANFQDPDDDGDTVGTAIERLASLDLLCDDDGSVPLWQKPDDDGDGAPTADEFDARPADGVADDFDEDDIPDYLDCDDDGDGILTEDEGTDDTDRDGIPDYLDPDSDNDTIFDREENEALADNDEDFVPDFQDKDDDGDGIDTLVELGDAAGRPGSLDEPADTDAAPDHDGDREPDWLDPDDDDDGIDTELEGGPDDDADDDGDPNYLDDDSDGDGLLDQDEGAIDADGDGDGNFLDPDADGDGFDDVLEGAVDTDGDGTPDFLDDDDDDDTVPSSDEARADTDGDGVDDRVDADDDGDGIPTETEAADGLLHGPDPDEDGLPNWVDDDSDGDGVPDMQEPDDADGDAIPDYLDADGVRRSYYRGSGLTAACATGPGSASGALAAAGALLLSLARRRRS